MIKGIFKKICLVLFGIISALVLAESILYVSGRVYYAYRIRNESTHLRGKDVVKILCLGDSCTFGMGAKQGYSYPEQLEDMLNKNSLGKKFIVYNRGRPGNTSSKLLNCLEAELETYNPDILIILIGTNDYGQIEGTNYFLLEYKGLRRIILSIEQYFTRSKIYKLFGRILDALTIRRWKHKLAAKFTSGSLILETSGCQSLSRPSIADTQKHKAYMEHINLGQQYWNQRERQEGLAIEEFKKAISIYPEREAGHLNLISVYMGTKRPALALEELKKVREINRCNTSIYKALWQAYYSMGQFEPAQEELEKYLYFKPNEIPIYSQFLKYGLPQLRNQESLRNLFTFNLKKTIGLAKRKNIKLILQGYPQTNDCSEWTKELAESYGILFVDNRKEFEEILLSQGSTADYFAPDTHPNEKGYFIIAENVYDIMKTNKLLEEKKAE